MNVKTWLQTAKKRIESLDAEIIALRVFAPPMADRSWLVAHDLDELDKQALVVANEFLEERADGYPMAYILGEKEFYGRVFEIPPVVLIPRPETEDIINLVKTLDLPVRPSFLEIGTGSGCIAITLALEYPQSYVLASDIDESALRVAQMNDTVLEGRVEFVQSNLFRDFEFEGKSEKFDVIVANLPYVNVDWDWVDTEKLSFEPSRALYATGNNGLSLYQRFLKEYDYRQNMKHDIWADYMVLEADPCQHQELIKMAEKHGLIHLKTEGYCLLFEDIWRYWLDSKTKKMVRKPVEVLQMESESGVIHFLPEELTDECGD